MEGTSLLSLPRDVESLFFDFEAVAASDRVDSVWDDQQLVERYEEDCS